MNEEKSRNLQQNKHVRKLKRRRVHIIIIAAAVMAFVFCGLTGCNEKNTNSSKLESVLEETLTESVTEEEQKIQSEADTGSETQIDSDNESLLEETPVQIHGQLSVSGTQIVDENGDAYQLKGISTHGISWFPQYVNFEAFQTMRDEWGVNAIRLAMYTAESGGYCTDGDQDYLKELVESGVSYAAELGMYVIIDWHVLNDNDPNTYKSQAIEFFEEMAALYKDNNNVIYEICNEPCGETSWSDVKSYANDVISKIRAIDSDSIIIVGTPNWSQQVDQAVADPLSGYSNIMYALHFYAATHTDSLRQTMVNAISSGLPVIVSEYGIGDASGNGEIDEAQANEWVDVMNKYGVSYMMWNLSNKDESSSLISSSCSRTSRWSYDELSDSGKWFVNMMGTKAQIGSTNENSKYSDDSVQIKSDSTEDKQNNIEASKQVSSSDVTVTVKCSNTWDTDDVTYRQYTVEINNTGISDISDWSVVLTFSSDVSIDQGWCGKFSAYGNQITITPESWNNTIAANSVCSDIGMIAITSGTLTKAEIK